MLYSFEYEQIARGYDGENVIIFIDVLQQLMNYYIKIIIGPKVLLLHLNSMTGRRCSGSAPLHFWLEIF
jgi:hypothetical protein